MPKAEYGSECKAKQNLSSIQITQQGGGEASGAVGLSKCPRWLTAFLKSWPTTSLAEFIAGKPVAF